MSGNKKKEKKELIKVSDLPADQRFLVKALQASIIFRYIMIVLFSLNLSFNIIWAVMNLIDLTAPYASFVILATCIFSIPFSIGFTWFMVKVVDKITQTGIADFFSSRDKILKAYQDKINKEEKEFDKIIEESYRDAEKEFEFELEKSIKESKKEK